MDKVLEFGKRYGKWIAAGVVATAVTVVGVIAYRNAGLEDEDYTGPEILHADESDQPEEG